LDVFIAPCNYKWELFTLPQNRSDTFLLLHNPIIAWRAFGAWTGIV
jgi:hypothetical protein